MKILLFILAVMFGYSAYARNQLTFMGMSIKGVYESFCQKLIDREFKPCVAPKPFNQTSNARDSIVWFERKEWANESNVHFCVYYSKRTHVVNTVIVWLPCANVEEAKSKQKYYYRKFREEYVLNNYDCQPEDYSIAIYNDRYDTMVDGMISVRQMRNYVGIMFMDCLSADVDIYEDLLTDYYKR